MKFDQFLLLKWVCFEDITKVSGDDWTSSMASYLQYCTDLPQHQGLATLFLQFKHEPRRDDSCSTMSISPLQVMNMIRCLLKACFFPVIH